MKVAHPFSRIDTGSTLRFPRHRLPIVLLAILSCLALLVLNVFLRVEYSGDEGFYGVTAVNMLRGPDWLLRPSYFPGGDFLSEKDAFAHPPFNSYLYALALWVVGGSMAGPELVNVVAFGLLLWAVWGILRACQPRAAPFAVALLAASPSLFMYYSQLEAEPLVTSFGMMALYCTLRAYRAGFWRRWLVLGGLCIGAAFAFKLWLCGPMALAIVAAVLVRSQGQWRRKTESLLILGIGSFVPALVHLTAIGLAHPEDLPFWLKDIYFGVFTGAGISGGKLEGADASSAWVHPFWYYGPALYRDHFFLVPPILMGLGVTARSRRARPLLWILAAGLAGLIPLSVLRVKEPLYVLSCAVLLYLLAGMCIATIIRQARARGGFRPPRLAIAAIGVLWIVFPIAFVKGFMPGRITSPFILAHSLIFPLWLVWALLSRQQKSLTAMRLSIYGAAAAAVLGFFLQGGVTRQPRDAMIANLLRPYVAGTAPRTVSMVASNFKSYQFLLYRTGCYWSELPKGIPPGEILSRPEFRNVRVFILDPEDAGSIALTPWLTWLEANAREITGQLDAKLHRQSGFRLFARNVPGGVADSPRPDLPLGSFK